MRGEKGEHRPIGGENENNNRDWSYKTRARIRQLSGTPVWYTRQRIDNQTEELMDESWQELSELEMGKLTENQQMNEEVKIIDAMMNLADG